MRNLGNHWLRIAGHKLAFAFSLETDGFRCLMILFSLKNSLVAYECCNPWKICISFVIILGKYAFLGLQQC